MQAAIVCKVSLQDSTIQGSCWRQVAPSSAISLHLWLTLHASKHVTRL